MIHQYRIQSLNTTFLTKQTLQNSPIGIMESILAVKAILYIRRLPTPREAQDNHIKYYEMNFCSRFFFFFFCFQYNFPSVPARPWLGVEYLYVLVLIIFCFLLHNTQP